MSKPYVISIRTRVRVLNRSRPCYSDPCARPIEAGDRYVRVHWSDGKIELYHDGCFEHESGQQLGPKASERAEQDDQAS